MSISPNSFPFLLLTLHPTQPLCSLPVLEFYIYAIIAGSLYFLRFYLFVERGEGRKKERERNINVWLLLTRPLGGTCLET